jgi:hypothetical protein
MLSIDKDRRDERTQAYENKKTDNEASTHNGVSRG